MLSLGIPGLRRDASIRDWATIFGKGFLGLLACAQNRGQRCG